MDLVSLIFNGVCTYIFIGVCICAYRDPKVRAAIMEIFWMSIKWGMMFKPEKLQALITKEIEVIKEKVVIKEVIKEVPVEVIKEVPVEVIKEVPAPVSKDAESPKPATKRAPKKK